MQENLKDLIIHQEQTSIPNKQINLQPQNIQTVQNQTIGQFDGFWKENIFSLCQSEVLNKQNSKQSLHSKNVPTISLRRLKLESEKQRKLEDCDKKNQICRNPETFFNALTLCQDINIKMWCHY